MNKRTRIAVAPCPDCEWEIRLGTQPEEGQKVACPKCGAELEIIDLDPPELDWVDDGFEPDWDPNEDGWD
jgi:alpha-aminoadipate carrier protein LysW